MSDLLESLRAPFPDGTVGLLPKLTCSACSKKQCQQHQKAKCRECGAYISTAHIHLDYVGHAAVTDRLLTVDPSWTWEPLATDEFGSPALDREGNLWIRLTVGGTTRIGCGDGQNMKERIGDAIRNAAMRFGVALSLWTKDELESGHVEQKATEAAQPPASAPREPSRRETHSTVRKAPVPQPSVDAETGEIVDAEVVEEPAGHVEQKEGHPVFGTCSQCGSVEWWDNRDKKASGQYKPNAADGKCKNKSCSKAVWLPKSDESEAAARVAEAFDAYEEEPF